LAAEVVAAEGVDVSVRDGVRRLATAISSSGKRSSPADVVAVGVVVVLIRDPPLGEHGARWRAVKGHTRGIARLRGSLAA
jgi:hypothetical protein